MFNEVNISVHGSVESQFVLNIGMEFITQDWDEPVSWGHADQGEVTLTWPFIETWSLSHWTFTENLFSTCHSVFRVLSLFKEINTCDNRAPGSNDHWSGSLGYINGLFVYLWTTAKFTDLSTEFKKECERFFYLETL